MDITDLIQLSAIPAALVGLGGLLVLYLGAEENAKRNFILYLLACAALVVLTIWAGSQFWKTPYDQAEFYLTFLFLPVVAGILALAVLHLDQLRHFRRGQIVLAVLFLIVLIGLGIVFSGSQRLSAMGLSALGVVLALVWAGGLRWKWLAGIILLLVLAGMAAFNMPVEVWFNEAENFPAVLRIVLAAVSLSFAILTVPLAAVLIQRALKSRGQEPILADGAGQVEAAQPGTSKRQHRWAPALQLGTAAILLSGLTYTIYWSSIWDHTSDGLGGVFLTEPGAMLAIGSGMLLMVFSTGWRRLSGLLFMVLVPLVLTQAFHRGWQVSYHAITEARAADIAAALERFHSRTGVYPQVLEELTPRDLLVVPQPIIMRGETWCYQSAADSYRLGAIFREYFSSPWSIQIYVSAGALQEESWRCDVRLEELQASYAESFIEQPVYSDQAERLPLSEVPVPRQTLKPVVEGTDLIPGGWSPDGRYLSFSRNNTLQILDVPQGLVCTGDVEISLAGDPRNSTTWLPDGRLLVIRSQGDLVLQVPCGAVSPLPGDESAQATHAAQATQAAQAAQFSEILAVDTSSSRMLLKAEESFWIFDGAKLGLVTVEEVTPNPYEFHWDSASWLPGGSRLAISRLNGRDSSEGSTLYILDGQSAEIQISLERAYAHDQSAPHVDWLSKNELLLHDGGALRLLDLSTDSPQEINVMQDLFGLDLAYPEDIAAMAFAVDPDGEGYYLAVRANHPRNQSIYLYSSATGQVQVYEHQNHSLLFFPDGQVDELPKSEIEPSYQDEYDLVWVDQPGSADQQLAVAGHTPRSYPSLFMRAEPGGRRFYFSSSQGVSLVTVPEGEMLAFWDLGGETAYVTGPEDTAANQHFVVVVDRVGLFILPDFTD